VDGSISSLLPSGARAGAIWIGYSSAGLDHTTVEPFTIVHDIIYRIAIKKPSPKTGFFFIITS